MDKAPIQKIIELSGLSQDRMNDFLTKAFNERGMDLESASLEDLRGVLADLLQDLILETNEH